MTEQSARGVRAGERGDVSVTWYLEISIFMKGKKNEKNQDPVVTFWFYHSARVN